MEGEDPLEQKQNAQKKPYRSVASNALWSFKTMWRDTPAVFASMMAVMPLNIYLAWANVYLPSLAAARVTGEASLAQGALAVGLLLLTMMAAKIGRHYLAVAEDAGLYGYRFHQSEKHARKAMDCFYQVYNRDLRSRAELASQMWNGSCPMTDVPRHCRNLIQNLVCYGLFGTMVSFVSPWLIPLLTLAPAVNWLCARAYQRWEYSHREQWADTDQKLNYVLKKPADFAAAKDIRIYGMAGWFTQVFQDLKKLRAGWDRKDVGRAFLSRIADLAVILLRDRAAYFLLISMTLRGSRGHPGKSACAARLWGNSA